MGFYKKYVSADGLIRTAQQSIAAEKFNACRNTKYTWQDCIISGLAIFSLKFPSLFQFDKLKSSDELVSRILSTPYGVHTAPSDTTLRERLDTIQPNQLTVALKIFLLIYNVEKL